MADSVLSITTLDSWIKILMEAKYIPENDIRLLCLKVYYLNNARQEKYLNKSQMFNKSKVQ